MELDNQIDIYTLSVKALKEHLNPLAAWNELDSPITKEEVIEVIENGEAELVDTPLVFVLSECPDKEIARKNHIKKIAYFVINGSDQPLDIELSINEEVLLNDGNHRLSGAIIRDDLTIQAEISGFVDLLKPLELLA
jgi:hypothetical protein